MKNLLTTSFTMMAFSLPSCATKQSVGQNYQGRVIEFKSDANGFDTRTFFYEGEHEVIAFDAQFTPDLAKKSIAHLRTITQKPITWLVITHPNPDKFNGASVFKAEGTKIISSQKTASNIPGVHSYKEYYFVEMAKMFKKGQYPQPVLVDVTFEKQTDLVLKGGQRIQLRELSGPAVSTNQTVAYIKTRGTLIVGDLVHNQAHAWLEGGIVNGQPTPTIKSWIADLDELTTLFPKDTMVLGGRGISAPLDVSVQSQKEYLVTAVKIVQDYVLESKGTNVDFKILAQRFQKQFPDYDLSYMIEYGAYGLAQSAAKGLNK